MLNREISLEEVSMIQYGNVKMNRENGLQEEWNTMPVKFCTARACRLVLYGCLGITVADLCLNAGQSPPLP